MAGRIGLFGIGMQLRRLTVMALVLGGLSMPLQAEEAIRLFAPVPAGKIVLRPPSTAQAPPRALVVRALPLMRGSLKDGEPRSTSRATVPAAHAPWLAAPQIIPEAADKTAAPPTDDWERAAPSPRIIRNAAR